MRSPLRSYRPAPIRPSTSASISNCSTASATARRKSPSPAFSSNSDSGNQGYKGALYAWESADTGEETTPDQVVGPNGDMIDILTGRMEHHISADIAYAVWQYWRSTGDDA